VLNVKRGNHWVFGSRAGEFCNGDGESRSWLVGNAAYQRGIELASQGIEPASGPAYLDNILLVAITATVAIVGGEINYLLLLQAGQDLPDGRKTCHRRNQRLLCPLRR